jgi:hypothetical protein
VHSDIFLPAVKVFGYNGGIGHDAGPFHFARGTHNNDERKLRYLYNVSRPPSPAFFSCGSPRVPMDGQLLTDYGLPDVQPIVFGSSRLIIADTSGFHKRGPAKPGVHRHFYTIDFHPPGSRKKQRMDWLPRRRAFGTLRQGAAQPAAPGAEEEADALAGGPGADQDERDTAAAEESPADGVA